MDKTMSILSRVLSATSPFFWLCTILTTPERSHVVAVSPSAMKSLGPSYRTRTCDRLVGWIAICTGRGERFAGPCHPCRSVNPQNYPASALSRL